MLHPKFAKKLIGHQKLFDQIVALYEKDQLSPCWILNGPQGIGKATFAYQLAIHLLSQNPNNLQGLPKTLVEHQIQVGSYPNLLSIEKKASEEEKTIEIHLEEAKKILPFLNQSAVISGWRVVIIDAVNELNRSAASSLLKILEEPPKKVLFLLISHSWGQVLPTVRSRCQRLNFDPLKYNDLLSNNVQMDEKLFNICEGSLGRCQEIIKAGGIEFLQLIGKMVQCALEGQWIQLQKFCQDTSKISEKFDCFLWLLPYLIYKKCLSSETVNHQYWLARQQKLDVFLTKAKTSHLDKNQLMTSCFLILENPYIN